MSNQLALDFIGTTAKCVDGVGADFVLQLAQQVSGAAACTHQGAVAHDVHEATQNLQHAFRAVHLGGRGQGHIHAARFQVGSNAEVDQAHGFQARVAIGQGAAHPRLVDGTSALFVACLGPQQNLAERPKHLVRPRSQTQPFVVELGRNELPATVQRAHQTVCRHLHVVVVGGGGEVAHGLDQRVREARSAGVGNQDRDALVAWQIGAGAHGQPDMVGRLHARGPQLVAVDHEMPCFQITLQTGLGLEHGQVGTGPRLGVANGKNRLAAGNAGQELFFLLGRTMLHQRGADGADGHERQRCPGNVGLFKEDQLLGGAQALAAVGFGPAHGQPAVTAHLAHDLAVLVAAFGTAQAHAQLGRHQVVEIVTHLQAQAVLLGGQIDKHRTLRCAPQALPKIKPLVGTPVPAVTSTLCTSATWLAAVPRTWRTASATPFMPWM